MGVIEDYERELHRLLEFSPSVGAGSWRALFQPSFDAECLIEVADHTLRVATPQRQIWAWVNRYGADPSAWVEPAVGHERIQLDAREVAQLSGILDRIPLARPTVGGVLMDGMPVTLARGSEEVGWNVSDRESSSAQLTTFARTLHAFAAVRVRWDLSRKVLEQVARYLP